MLMFYVQQIVFIAIDASLFAWIALHLLTPPAQLGESERRRRNTLIFLSVALVFLGLLHVMSFGVRVFAGAWGRQLWTILNWVFPLLSIMIYIGFGGFLAAAIWQLSKAVPSEGMIETSSNPQLSAVRATRDQPTAQYVDWGYLWKQARIGFFRCIGVVLLIGAAPLAFIQMNPGVGVMALATAAGCLWLGFHRKSPLAIKYASLAEEDAD